MHSFKLLVTTNAKKMKALKTKELQKLSGGFAEVTLVTAIRRVTCVFRHHVG